MTVQPAETTKEKLQASKFYHRAVQYLRSEFPKKTKDIDDDALRISVYEGCIRASDYGLDSEEHAMGFVDMQWRLTTDFDKNKKTHWAGEVLNDSDLDAEMKLATLRNAYALFTALEEDKKHK